MLLLTFAGHAGVACGSCAKGYTMSHGHCKGCSGKSKLIGGVSLMVLLALLLCAAMCQSVLANLVNLTVSYMQSVSLIAMTTTTWQSPTRDLFAVLQVSLLANLEAMECVVHVPFPYIWAMQVFAIFVLLAVSAAPPFRSRVTAIASRAAFFLYPGAVLNALRLFDCPTFKLGNTDLRLLHEEASWDCGAPRHYYFQSGAFAFIVLTSLLSLAIFAKACIHRPDGPSDKVLQRLKHIFYTVKVDPSKRWHTDLLHWHLITMARQLGLCVVVVSLRKYPMERTLFSLLVLVVCWTLHACCSRFGEISEVAVEACPTLLLLAARALLMPQVNPGSRYRCGMGS